MSGSLFSPLALDIDEFTNGALANLSETMQTSIFVQVRRSLSSPHKYEQGYTNKNETLCCKHNINSLDWSEDKCQVYYHVTLAAIIRQISHPFLVFNSLTLGMLTYNLTSERRIFI